MAMTYVQRGFGVAVAVTAALTAASCGDVSRTGRSPVMLVIEGLEATRGGETQAGSFLLSDVLTEGGVINDSGTARLAVVLKNPGPATAPLSPTSLNAVTISRYRVRFVRTDGRSTQGVDIPYGFDGGLTVTVPSNGSAAAGFDLVRHQAKLEPPLRNLRGLGSAMIISTIAEITFYGQDMAGNEIEVTGKIQVNFGDFADPS